MSLCLSLQEIRVWRNRRGEKDNEESKVRVFCVCETLFKGIYKYGPFGFKIQNILWFRWMRLLLGSYTYIQIQYIETMPIWRAWDGRAAFQVRTRSLNPHLCLMSKYQSIRWAEHQHFFKPSSQGGMITRNANVWLGIENIVGMNIFYQLGVLDLS